MLEVDAVEQRVHRQQLLKGGRLLRMVWDAFNAEADLERQLDGFGSC
jgi:hypothetical protein